MKHPAVFLLLPLLVATWVHQEGDDNIHFKRLGQVIGSLSYGHLRLDMNTTSIIHTIEQYCTFRFEDKVPHKKIGIKNFASSLQNLLNNQCRTLRNDYKETLKIYVNKFNSRFVRGLSLSRPERQAGLLLLGVVAIGSYLFSHSQLLSLSQGANAHTVRVLQEHETRLTVNTRSIKILNETVSDLLKAVLSVEDELRATEAAFRFHVSYEAVEREVGRIMGGLHALADHQLSPSLAHTKSLAEATVDLKHELALRQLQLLIDRVEDLYHMDVSFISFQNGSLVIFVHVPAYREGTLLDLYQIVPTPLAIGKSKYLLPKPEGEILAVSPARNLFRIMSLADLARCRSLRSVYYCEGQNYYDKRAKASCLVGLFLNDGPQILNSCHFGVGHLEDYMVQLTPHEFLLYQSEPSIVEKVCGDDSQRESFKGLRKIIVEPGCQVTTSSFSFSGAVNVYGATRAIQNRLDNFTSEFNFHELREGLEHAQDRLSLVGSKDGLKIRDLMKEFDKIHATSVFRWSVFGTIIVIILGILTLCLLRLRHFRKRVVARRNIISLQELNPQENSP